MSRAPPNLQLIIDGLRNPDKVAEWTAKGNALADKFAKLADGNPAPVVILAIAKMLASTAHRANNATRDEIIGAVVYFADEVLAKWDEEDRA